MPKQGPCQVLPKDLEPNLKGRSTVELPPQEPGHGAQCIGQTSRLGAEAPTTAFGWEKPLNTHTRRRTSLVWAGCGQQAAGPCCIGSPWVSLHFDHSVHNTTADEMGQHRVFALLTPWLWSLFVQLAGGSPRPTGCPTSSSRICRGDSSSDSTITLLGMLCQFRSSWRTPRRACSALMLNRCPLPKGSHTGHTETISLVGRSTALRHRSAPIAHPRVWGDGVERTRASSFNTAFACGMGHAR